MNLFGHSLAQELSLITIHQGKVLQYLRATYAHDEDPALASARRAYERRREIAKLRVRSIVPAETVLECLSHFRAALLELEIWEQ